MDITIFLAQAFGILFVIGGAGLLLHPHITKEIIERFSSDRTVVWVGGYLALMLGAPLVLIHNIWDGGALATVVTVIAWLTFLKGVGRVLAPDIVTNWALLFESKPNLIKIMLAVMVLVGVYLAYAGFGLG